MSEARKYFYMRLKDDFFDGEEMMMLEAMPDGYIYQNILLKMYCRSLKNDGRLMFNNLIPYSPQMLATITRQQVGTVEKALKVFQQLGLIEILDNGAIYMLNIQNYIGKSSSEADRKREYYIAIQEEKERLLGEKCGDFSGDFSTRDRDRDISKSKSKAKAKNAENGADEADICPYQKIIELYHGICVSYPHIRGIDGERKKSVKARWTANPSLETFKELFTKAEASSFLKGCNDRKWHADFDFMMKPSKFTLILEGKYDDRKQPEQDDGIDHSMDFMFGDAPIPEQYQYKGDKK